MKAAGLPEPVFINGRNEFVVVLYNGNQAGAELQQPTEPNKVDGLLEEYFKNLFDNNVIVGEIYTRLGLEGEEKSGPLKAAKELVKFIK